MPKRNLNDCFEDGRYDGECGFMHKGIYYCHKFGFPAAEAYKQGYEYGKKLVAQKVAAANGYTLNELNGV